MIEIIPDLHLEDKVKFEEGVDTIKERAGQFRNVLNVY